MKQKLIELRRENPQVKSEIQCPLSITDLTITKQTISKTVVDLNTTQ